MRLVPTSMVITPGNRRGVQEPVTFRFPDVPEDRLILELILPLEDLDRASTEVSLQVSASPDNGGVWYKIGAGTWIGHPKEPKRGIRAWRLRIDQAKQYVGWLGKIELATVNTLNIGLRVTV